MSLEELASDIELTDEQCPRSVAVVDSGTTSLRSVLHAHRDALLCDPDTAASIVRAAIAGQSVETIAMNESTVRIIIKATLHRCGVRTVQPLSEAEYQLLQGWIRGDRQWVEIKMLVDAPREELELARYTVTHPPVPEIKAVVTRLQTNGNVWNSGPKRPVG